MTFTITSELEEAHPPNTGEAELTSAYSAAVQIGGNCLQDGPVGRVGLEVEAHCYDLSDPMRRPDWDELTEAIAGVPTLPGGSVVTVEPGGAVELSGPPMDGASTAITAMSADRAVLRAAFAQAGLGLVLLGADPLRPAKRVNPGARYRAMEQFFAASGTGAAGAAMMTSTASVQVNLYAGPRAGWAPPTRRCSVASSPVGAAAVSGSGVSWTRPAAERSWAPTATIRPATGPGTRCGPR